MTAGIWIRDAAQVDRWHAPARQAKSRKVHQAERPADFVRADGDLQQAILVSPARFSLYEDFPGLRALIGDDRFHELVDRLSGSNIPRGLFHAARSRQTGWKNSSRGSRNGVRRQIPSSRAISCGSNGRTSSPSTATRCPRWKSTALLGSGGDPAKLRLRHPALHPPFWPASIRSMISSSEGAPYGRGTPGRGEQRRLRTGGPKEGVRSRVARPKPEKIWLVGPPARTTASTTSASTPAAYRHLSRPAVGSAGSRPPASRHSAVARCRRTSVKRSRPGLRKGPRSGGSVARNNFGPPCLQPP